MAQAIASQQKALDSLTRMCVLVTQSCPTLCGPMGHNLTGLSVHRILQVRKLEWVAISFSIARILLDSKIAVD